jgi:hypothetical protein
MCGEHCSSPSKTTSSHIEMAPLGEQDANTSPYSDGAHTTLEMGPPTSAWTNFQRKSFGLSLCCKILTELYMHNTYVTYFKIP